MEDVIKRFLSVSSGDGDGYGYGYGSGYGYGDGYGSGYGYGDGYGSGDGSGDGYGSGDGSGYGYGYGDGYGSGDGYGYGYSSGDGSGYGYGDGDGYGYGLSFINGKEIHHVDGVQTIIESVKGNYAIGYILNRDLSLKPCYIAKVDNRFAHGETLRDAVADATNKAMQAKPIEERIDEFITRFGGLDSVHKGQEFYDWHNILTGSCRMGRDQFCEEHGIDLSADYTVGYFLDITTSSYGADVIQQLKNRYKEE